MTSVSANNFYNSSYMAAISLWTEREKKAEVEGKKEASESAPQATSREPTLNEMYQAQAKASQQRWDAHFRTYGAESLESSELDTREKKLEKDRLMLEQVRANRKEAEKNPSQQCQPMEYEEFSSFLRVEKAEKELKSELEKFTQDHLDFEQRKSKDQQRWIQLDNKELEAIEKWGVSREHSQQGTELSKQSNLSRRQVSFSPFGSLQAGETDGFPSVVTEDPRGWCELEGERLQGEHDAWVRDVASCPEVPQPGYSWLRELENKYRMLACDEPIPQMENLREEVDRSILEDKKGKDPVPEEPDSVPEQPSVANYPLPPLRPRSLPTGYIPPSFALVPPPLLTVGRSPPGSRIPSEHLPRLGDIRIEPPRGGIAADIAAGTGKGIGVIVSINLLDLAAAGETIAVVAELLAGATPVLLPLAFLAFVGGRFYDDTKRWRAERKFSNALTHRQADFSDLHHRYTTYWKGLLEVSYGQLQPEQVAELERASVQIGKKMDKLTGTVEEVSKNKPLPIDQKVKTINKLAPHYVELAEIKAIVDHRLSLEDFHIKHRGLSAQELLDTVAGQQDTTKATILTALYLRTIALESAADREGHIEALVKVVPNHPLVQNTVEAIRLQKELNGLANRSLTQAEGLDLAGALQTFRQYVEVQNPDVQPLHPEGEPAATGVKKIASAGIDANTTKDLNNNTGDNSKDGVNTQIEYINGLSLSATPIDFVKEVVKRLKKLKHTWHDRKRDKTISQATWDALKEGADQAVTALEQRVADKEFFDRLQDKDFNGLISLFSTATNEAQKQCLRSALKTTLEGEMRQSSPLLLSHLQTFGTHFTDPHVATLATNLQTRQHYQPIFDQMGVCQTWQQFQALHESLMQTTTDPTAQEILRNIVTTAEDSLTDAFAQLHNHFIGAIFTATETSQKTRAECRRELLRLYRLDPTRFGALYRKATDWYLLSHQAQDADTLLRDWDTASLPQEQQRRAFASYLQWRQHFLHFQQGSVSFADLTQHLIEAMAQVDTSEKLALAQLYQSHLSQEQLPSADEIQQLRALYGDPKEPQLAALLGDIETHKFNAISSQLRAAALKQEGADFTESRTELMGMYRQNPKSFESLYEESIFWYILAAAPQAAQELLDNWETVNLQLEIDATSSRQSHAQVYQPFIDYQMGHSGFYHLHRQFIALHSQMEDSPLKKKCGEAYQVSYCDVIESTLHVSKEVADTFFRTLGRDLAQRPSMIPGLGYLRDSDIPQGVKLFFKYANHLNQLDATALPGVLLFSAFRDETSHRILKDYFWTNPNSEFSIKALEQLWKQGSWQEKKNLAALLRLARGCIGVGQAHIGNRRVRNLLSYAETGMGAVRIYQNSSRKAQAAQGLALAVPMLLQAFEEAYERTTGDAVEHVGFHAVKQVLEPLASAAGAFFDKDTSRLQGGLAAFEVGYSGLQIRKLGHAAALRNVQNALNRGDLVLAEARLKAIVKANLRVDDRDFYDILNLSLIFSQALQAKERGDGAAKKEAYRTFIQTAEAAPPSLKHPTISLQYCVALCEVAESGWRDQFAAHLGTYAPQPPPHILQAMYHSVCDHPIASEIHQKLARQVMRAAAEPEEKPGWLCAQMSRALVWGGYQRQATPALTAPAPKTAEADAAAATPAAAQPAPKEKYLKVNELKVLHPGLFATTVAYLDGTTTAEGVQSCLRTLQPLLGGSSSLETNQIRGWIEFLEVLADCHSGKEVHYEKLDSARQLGFVPALASFYALFLPKDMHRLCSQTMQLFDYKTWSVADRLLFFMRVSDPECRDRLAKMWAGEEVSRHQRELDVKRELCLLVRSVIGSPQLDRELLDLFATKQAPSCKDVQALLSQGASPDQVHSKTPYDTRWSNTLLHTAAMYKRAPLLRLLGKYGVDIDMKNLIDMNALATMLCRCPQGDATPETRECIRVLLNLGSDIQASSWGFAGTCKGAYHEVDGNLPLAMFLTSLFGVFVHTPVWYLNDTSAGYDSPVCFVGWSAEKIARYKNIVLTAPRGK